MPSPDTEMLAARLRAVERALTDEDAVPDPPSTSPADTSPGNGNASTPHEHRNEPATTVDRRLCRLEAAVQALRAALDDGPDTTPPDTPTSEERPSEVSGGEEPPSEMWRTEESTAEVPGAEEPTAGAAGERDTARDNSGTVEHPDPPRRVPDGGHWPDDLATE